MTPAELVEKSRKNGTWYDRLDKVDRNYVDEVIAIAREYPDISLTELAKGIKAETSVTATVKTIRVSLSEMLNG